MTRQRDDSNRPRRGAGGKPPYGGAGRAKPGAKAGERPRKAYGPKGAAKEGDERRDGRPPRKVAAGAAPRKSFRPKASDERRGSESRDGRPRREATAAAAAPQKTGRPRPPAGRGTEKRAQPRRILADGAGAPEAPRTEPVEHEEEARIAKVMARAGLCSRRVAEGWIAEGRVSVNDVVLTSPAFNVGPEDRILVDGVPLKPRERTRLFTFHKPRGLVTTDRDPEGRPTIFSALPEDLPRLVTIGRLDINTEGLLLLTNDGGLARILELPSTGWLRRYRVRANGTTDQAALDRLRDGITIDGIDYQGIEAQLDRVQGANVWLTMGLREGKNREVKKVLEHLGLFVNRLIRVSFGPFQLGLLEEGKVEEIRTRVIREQLGAELSREAGLDFEAPVLTAEERHAAVEGPREPEAARTGQRSGPRPERAAPRPIQRERRPERAAAPVAEELRPPHPGRPKPGPRKHISILRAEERAAAATGRKRTERAETSDRKGRIVAVERITPVTPAAKSSKPPSRNARRFAADRGEAAGPAVGERPKRTAGGSERPRRSGEDRPAAKRDGSAFGERTVRYGAKPRFEKGPGRERPSGPSRPRGAPQRPGGPKGQGGPKRPGGGRPRGKP